ncbi:MAG: hypothetical protein WC058_06270 [Phycisphaeraceae bacterium]
MRYMVMLAVVGLLVVGCETNKGMEKEERIDTRKADGGQIGSADLTAATEKVVESIANVPAIHQAGERVVIVMDQVTNETLSDPSANFQIYLARIRALLNQSGQTKNLMFVETRVKSEQIKQREGYPAAATARTLPRYALTAAFYDLPRGRSNYYLLTFQLFDLTNDAIVWENSYEVKL